MRLTSIGDKLTACAIFLTIGMAPMPACAQSRPPCLITDPDIHGDKIVFSAEGDLWLGSLANGVTARITTHEGREYLPHFSPDGTQIAFTASYDGGRDVYIMPSDGGAPRRLTFDPDGAEALGWSSDGKRVLFRSRRAVPFVGYRLYLVDANGGLPTALPIEKAAQGAFSRDGMQLAFCRLNRQNNPWKHYRGGQANHIWIADLGKMRFRRIDDETINEQFPVWAGDNIYYVSERDGTANLWRYDAARGKSTRLTAHDTYDVTAPGTDGKRLIYTQGGSLWIYDIASGKEQRVQLSLASDRIHARPLTLPGSVSEFALGPTGKRLVVQTRGQIATLGVEKGEARLIAPQIGSRSQHPVWSPDGKSIAFVSDRGGEENIWVAPAGAGGEAKPLTRETRWRINGLTWSPDSKDLLFTDDKLTLWLLNAETMAKSAIVQAKYLGPIQYAFSPDSKWIAYIRQENNIVRSLYLYNRATRTSTRLTSAPTIEGDVAFDPTGKFLYFTSQRNIAPQPDGFDFQNDLIDTIRIYALALSSETPSPFAEESDEEPGSVPGDATKPMPGKPAPDKASAPAGENKGAAEKRADIRVDLDGLAERLIELPVPAGRYSQLSGVPGKLLYLAQEGAAGPQAQFKLRAFDFETKKVSELGAGVTGYSISTDAKKLAAQTSAGITVSDAGAAPGNGKMVDAGGLRVEVNPEKEWKQIFAEAWRNQRDLFYDPELHGLDWEAVRRKYEALLPAVGDRSDLNLLIGEMQGEMSVSHEFNRGGYFRRTAPTNSEIGALGADLSYRPADRAYQLTRIYSGDGFDSTARSPLLVPGLKVKQGDYLLSIDGAALKPDEDPAALLIGKAGKIVVLKVNSKPGEDGSHLVRVRAMPTDAPSRYYDWVQKCRDYVTRNGGANLGYLHLPDMDERGIVEFTKHFYANLDKDGLVIDVRYNQGGIVSGQILERLRRVIFEYDQSRYGAPIPYHFTAYTGRIVILCNEGTSSDGEYFCTGARYMKLGPIVGTRTWGGYMAVNGFPTIDGGAVTTPVAASFSPEGKWLPDGHGFDPDYVVDEDPNAFAAGRDPQLDRAIELLRAEIKRNPPRVIDRIPPPTKERQQERTRR